MSCSLKVDRAGPLCTVQDGGRPNLLAHGISASGPMDIGAHRLAGTLAGACDETGIEFTRAGLDLQVESGGLFAGWAGGAFEVRVNGEHRPWPGVGRLAAGDRLNIMPGAAGNYGYLRFNKVLDLPMVLGSRATSTRARLGGLEGRALRAGDVLRFAGEGGHVQSVVPPNQAADCAGAIRITWGIHADRFAAETRRNFVGTPFRVTNAMDRMGVRLADEKGVFAGSSILSLISDPILPGDVQILGDGTPIVLMRDHQPTGGYPRIGTIISADLDRFAQMRPGEEVVFVPVSVDHAHRLMRSAKP
ncbi:biotin-dependent carboxylase-like uncharacterized protein [Devosia subaequoris]|uniref:Biotin-dependent carboxylase-like uncharacterized protein n=1 Tax=Devosia subaequoris TaxID=395930 RepID=A0A7W6NA23_9HYPH|nr:biotin-dependent carboxyltransferase family protein [Devosia subaequoris]MBB4050442.1 biotin-dependent carboxylase-like uncharacterized protein [Devosia subaequoris]MCP1208869.1 biotin-dependent carboxyltransferase family protein [Devosia subaequoris]